MISHMTWEEIERAKLENPERIVFVNLDDEVIYATDSEGHELLKLGIRVLDRETRTPMLVTIQFPEFDELDLFRQECLEWFATISAYAPSAVAIEKIEELSHEDAYAIWRKITGALLSYKPSRDMGMRIFFRFLAPYVEQIESVPAEQLAAIAERKGLPIPTRSIDKSSIWLRGNVCAKVGMQMMVAILCVNDYIKKNAISALEKIFRWAILQPSVPKSPSPKEQTQIVLDGSPRLRSGFGYDA